MADTINADCRIERREEDQLSATENASLATLLEGCFPGAFDGRVYFKQLPNFRFLAWHGDQLCGQVGLSHRVMRLGETPMRVFGVIDLCVTEPDRRSGIGGTLLESVIRAARPAQADFVLLFADDPRLYTAHGFVPRKNPCRWLAMDGHRTLGVQVETLDDCMLSLSLRDFAWPEHDELDMLGYLY